MRRPLVFEPDGRARMAEAVELALIEARRRRILPGLSEIEQRMLFGRRIVRAVERGEDDVAQLVKLALQDDTSRIADFP